MTTDSKHIAWGLTLLAFGGILLLKRKKSTLPSLITDPTMKNYFSDREFTRSETAEKYGIKNVPTDAEWARIHALRDHVLNPAREYLGYPIYITSGFRSEELNKKVGGAATSQHRTGEAADITTKNLAKNRELFEILVQMGNYDQLIWEKGGDWIHVSFREKGGRGDLLSYDGKHYYDINNNWQTAIV